MKEAKYHEAPRWVWECPECDNWHEESEDPAYMDTVVCEECETEFKPVPE